MKIADVIKYEGDNKTIIWKHPSEDFNKFTQLIVHQSQEAVFFMNGEALDTFGPGRHTLDTENIPVLTRFLNRFTGDENPFHCEVYFINKVEQMAIKWGTPEQFYINEDINGISVPFKIGARGEMSIKVDDSRKLLLKLVGTEDVLTQDKFVEYFFSIVVSKVKSSISKTMRERKISIFTVDENLVELSDCLKGELAEDLADYGVVLERFIVASIKKPEGEPEYEKFKKLRVGRAIDLQAAQLEQELLNIEKRGEVERTVMESQGMAIKRQQEGYTYQEEQTFRAVNTAAANEGVGQYSNVGIGLGMMTGLGASIGNQVSGMATGVLNNIGNNNTDNNNTGNNNTDNHSGIICKKCQNSLPQGAMFCFKCGEKVVTDDRVECPACHKMTPKGEFCIYCGHSFEPAKCTNCGSELVEGAMFCLKCGHKIN